MDTPDDRGNGDWAHLIQFSLAFDEAERRRCHRPPRRPARPHQARPRPPENLDGYALLLPWSVMGSLVRPDCGGWLSGPML